LVVVFSIDKDVVGKDVVPLVEGVTVAGNIVTLIEDGVAAPTETAGKGVVSVGAEALTDDNGAVTDGEDSAKDVATGRVWFSKAGPVTRT
jgi:hypothetical protein